MYILCSMYRSYLNDIDLVYRFIDTFISDPWDVPVTFEDLEMGLLELTG